MCVCVIVKMSFAKKVVVDSGIFDEDPKLGRIGPLCHLFGAFDWMVEARSMLIFALFCWMEFLKNE